MDENLQIERLREGDKNALYSLYDRYSGALFGVVLRMCRDRGMAEDLLQEIFLTIWEKIDQFDPSKGKFYTWAYRIARNKTLNALRKSDPLIQTEDMRVYKDIREEETTQDFEALNGVVMKLEDHHQKVIELVYFKGYTHREAHKIMGVPLGTFKSYVRQALIQLREKYPTAFTLLLLCLDVIEHG
ncbi:RNA polymerase sigma-70 factor, ECF subfamily [Muriicola jejuensis]|uniref:Sigma-70 family RNA polymerase sigma factor n=1 Tax=Muriicola jejuensis TaxID=504488 RepID=A0A6P0UG90_9FLAO|nr:RNA polymerase sigma factor [Muriicola jejuensis]NER09136.1 sigma-70 family RNA polymerase sigma factor [Muriicola jejuensis]SMP10779.1 RNA polymerase sigma-70 factor, ECF subfamily [Muriicola jejuensis]